MRHDEFLDRLQQRVRYLDWVLSNRDVKSIRWWEHLTISFMKVKLYFEGRNEIEEAQARERQKYFTGG